MNRHVWSRRVAPGARNAWGRERERAKGPSPSYSWASSNAMQMKGFLYLLSSILGVWKAAWRLVQGDTRYTIQERRAEWTGSVCVCVCVQCWAFRGSDGLRAARPSLLTNTYTLLSHKPWCLSEISHTVKKYHIMAYDDVLEFCSLIKEVSSTVLIVCMRRLILYPSSKSTSFAGLVWHWYQANFLKWSKLL